MILQHVIQNFTQNKIGGLKCAQINAAFGWCMGNHLQGTLTLVIRHSIHQLAN